MSMISHSGDPSNGFVQQQPDLPPWAPLLRPDVSYGLRRLVERLSSCSSVRNCLLAWYFLADYFGTVRGLYGGKGVSSILPGLGVSPSEILSSASALHLYTFTRIFSIKAWEVYGPDVQRAVIDGLKAEQQSANHEEGPPAAGKCVVLVHFTTKREKVRSEAQPFIDLLRCFAKRQGMNFLHDISEGPSLVWTGKLPGGLAALDTYVMFRQSADNASLVASALDNATLRKEELLTRLARVDVWRRVQRSLDIISGSPVRWAKVQSIAKALDTHDAVLFFDYDVTVRPDCLGASRLIDHLFEPNWRGTKPSIVVRDSPEGVDCLNTGFVAFRSTGVARKFLEQWQIKLRWPGLLHGDQGTFAETLLEFMHTEYVTAGLGSSGGYANECLEHLVPTVDGLQYWRGYCDCFQKTLTRLAGPFPDRDSVHIRFLNPRRVDVNFVPNSLTPKHMQDIRKMRLLPHQPAGVRRHVLQIPRQIKPMFVHWAGIPNRTRLMREYLVRAFDIKPRWFKAGVDADDRCNALARMSPRSNTGCGIGPGKLGTRLEHIFQPFRFYEATDLSKSTDRDEAAMKTLELVTSESVSDAAGVPWEPDRNDDARVTSTQFRKDLLRLLGRGETTKTLTALELGGYRGYTARFLARHFHSVTVVEPQPEDADIARRVLAVYSNAQVQTTLGTAGGWDQLLATISDLGSMDLIVRSGRRDYESVRRDLEIAVAFAAGRPSRRWLALDDFFVFAEVTQAAVDFEDLGLLRRAGSLGVEEGLLFEVVADESTLRSLAK
eukprot:TRINITY_DN26107_c0_g1_i1.p1 TRINITY_DN26107_c0_g1~~TRINITY_DN26107_c0_g1_i1.p1  ORF type:complete len:777 (+),score=55.54 TRINITY_DN26107_c0_g1_i1:148-2478(+)